MGYGAIPLFCRNRSGKSFLTLVNLFFYAIYVNVGIRKEKPRAKLKGRFLYASINCFLNANSVMSEEKGKNKGKKI